MGKEDLRQVGLEVAPRAEFKPRICALVFTPYRDPVIDRDVVRAFQQGFGLHGIDPVFVEPEENILRQSQIQRTVGALSPDIVFVSVYAIEHARKLSREIPYIVLGNKNIPSIGSLKRLTSLDLGAAHYTDEPTNISVLAAHVKAIVQKREIGRARIFASENIRIDFEEGSVFVDGKPVALTPTEWNLLCFFARNPGRILPSGEVLTKVWGFEYSEDTEYLKKWVYKLRQKLGDDAKKPRILTTLIQRGYLFGEPYK